jgi:hypothetical protein
MRVSELADKYGFTQAAISKFLDRKRPERTKRKSPYSLEDMPQPDDFG